MKSMKPERLAEIRAAADRGVDNYKVMHELLAHIDAQDSAIEWLADIWPIPEDAVRGAFNSPAPASTDRN